MNLLGPGPSLMKKKNLPGRGLTKVQKHWTNSGRIQFLGAEGVALCGQRIPLRTDRCIRVTWISFNPQSIGYHTSHRL